MPYPKVIIDRDKLAFNLRTLIKFYGERGMSITPVTKGVCGSVEIARMLSREKIHSIGDSHLENIEKMKKAGVDAKFMLLRAPMRHEISRTAELADFSLNTEIETIRRLDQAASALGRKHAVILMVELGDRREGIMPDDLNAIGEEVAKLNNIRLAGIGANLTCLNGIKPTAEKMDALGDLAARVETITGAPLEIVSGGNSSSYQWAESVNNGGRINHVRIGESFLLGSDPITQSGIAGLKMNAFTLQAEVIESKVKPSAPDGEMTYDAFGNVPEIVDEGETPRAILAIGQQDVDASGCIPVDEHVQIIGVTSDHMVLRTREPLKVGAVVSFHLKYRALLPLMVSPYVQNEYV